MLAVLLAAIAGGARAESISVADMELTPGSQTAIIINCDFTSADITAYQFDLYLPDGVTLAKNNKGRYAAGVTYVLSDRHDEHTASLKDNDGFVRFVVSQNDKYTLTSGSGELLRVIVDVADTYSGSGNGEVKNFIMSEVDQTKHYMSDIVFALTVPPSDVPATGISLDPPSATLTQAGETLQLTATVSPDDATNKGVTWESSNPDVATVDDEGLVTAVANGTATITVTTADGSSKSATCEVTVAIPDEPQADQPEVAGKTFKLSCARGYVGYDGEVLVGTTQENASEFTIVEYDGTSYLFDVTNAAFVIHTTAETAGTTGNRSLESSTNRSKAVTGLTWGRTGFDSYPWYLEDSFGNWLNLDGSMTVCMNTWTDFENAEGGNTFQVEIVNDDFDATEALQIISNASTMPEEPEVPENYPDVAGKSFKLSCARGYVGSNGTQLIGTTQDNASEFAIVEYDGTSYLFDVTNSAFVVHTKAEMAGTTGNKTLESTTDLSRVVTGLTWGRTGFDSYPWYLEDSFGNWLNMDPWQNVFMNTWKDFENAEGGNTYQVEIVNDDFDATQAVEILDNMLGSESDYAIYVSDVVVGAGATAKLSICMKNRAPIRSFQFDMYLPEGVTALTNVNGRIRAALSDERLSETDERVVSASNLGWGAIYFTCSSRTDDAFTGTDGKVAELEVRIAEDMAEGSYPITLKNEYLVLADSKQFFTESVESDLSVGPYNPEVILRGDMNNDGKISVADMTAILNIILGQGGE